MGIVQKKAEEIFNRENPPDRFGCPYGKDPGLYDLWVCDQEEYI